MNQRRPNLATSVVFLILSFNYVTRAQNNNFCPTNMIQLYNGITCQTDQACQRLSNGFFCYRGHCCANSVSVAGSYGSSCSSNNQCTFSQGECLGNICYCRNGFNFDGNYCQPSQFNSNPINPLILTQQFPQLTQQQNCAPSEIRIANQCYQLRGYYDECDFTQQCNFVGSSCIDRKCSCMYMDIFNGFQCIKDSMLSATVSCQPNQVYINNQCYLIASIGEICIFDQQCRSTVSGGVACINGVCQQIGGRTRDQGAVCRNPAATVEMIGTAPKNCVSSSCNSGYYCEYNSAILQYICCGSTNNGQYGQIKMYPGYTNLPLQCNGINSCTFVDYPYCVFSQTYKHNVCCTQGQCI